MVETNREYWNRMAESDQVNWHISHHTDAQEDEFWDSGESVKQKILKASHTRDLDSLPPGTSILDIGCGRGRIARTFANARPDIKVVGVDVSTSMIANARVSNAHLPNLQFFASEETGFPFLGSESCSLIYSYVVFQHLPRYLVERILYECRRILSPSGELIFQVQSTETAQELDPPWNDYRTIRKYTRAQLEHVLAPLFDEVQITGGGHDMFAACRSPNTL